MDWLILYPPTHKTQSRPNTFLNSNFHHSLKFFCLLGSALFPLTKHTRFVLETEQDVACICTFLWRCFRINFDLLYKGLDILFLDIQPIRI